MTPTRTVLLLALATSAAVAQTPYFNDGPAFGGSRVFSEGLNPLGNAARFDRPVTGTYLSWLQGDAGGKETLSALKSGDPLLLGALPENAWALRTRAYGISYAEKGVHSSYTHEETTAAIANPNLSFANPNSIELRRAVVDRTCIGAGSAEQGSGYGIVMRVERWRTSIQAPQAPGPAGTQEYLAFTGTQSTTTLITFDIGYTLELAQGIRFGATADRLLARHFGDVYEGPLLRAGFQVDLGSLASLSLDSDVNKAMRMPFPIRQRVSTASLRLAPSPILTLVFGAERRSLGGEAIIRGGVSLFLNSPGWRLGAGFQFTPERPMMGLAFSGF